MRQKKNPTRQQVLEVCAEQPVAPGEIAAKLDRGINATYLAVADLERSGLLRRDEKGRYYIVNEGDSSEAATGKEAPKVASGNGAG